MPRSVFEWLSADTGLSVEKCESLFSGWRVSYHTEKGELAAAALCRGTEIHFIVAPEWRRRLIRRDNATAFLAPLLDDANGMLTTRVLHGSSGADSFVRRIGFEWTWSDETFNYYALCKLPFTRQLDTPT